MRASRLGCLFNLSLAVVGALIATSQAAYAWPSRRLPADHGFLRRKTRLAGSCGYDWQRQYAALHSSILSGRAPPRFVVSLGADVGLADRLAGTFSLFYYALMSGRAFQIASYPGAVSFREALEPVNVDWHRPDLDESIIKNIK